jgi:tryptophan-rich sensory protein
MTTVSRTRSAAALTASLAAVSVAAGIGGAGTAAGVQTWYPSLDRPSWRPPDKVFAPVWTVLYAANAVSAWLVWRADPRASRPALTLYGAQLALNAWRG